MAVPQPEPINPATFCEHCGVALSDGDHARCATPLGEPRFCTRCGRRLKVQVYPDRYDARCLVCDQPEGARG